MLRIPYHNISLTIRSSIPVIFLTLLLWLQPVKVWAQPEYWPLFYPAQALHWEGVLLTIVFFAFALAMPMCHFLLGQPTDGLYWPFSLLATACAVSLVSQLDIRIFLLDQPFFWDTLAMTATYLLPAAYFSLLARGCDNGRSFLRLMIQINPYETFAQLYILFTLATLVVVTTGLIPFYSSLSGFYLLTALVGILTTADLVREYRRGSLPARIILTGTGIFFLILCISLAFKLGGSTFLPHYTTHWGLALLLLILSFLIRLRIEETNLDTCRDLLSTTHTVTGIIAAADGPILKWREDQHTNPPYPSNVPKPQPALLPQTVADVVSTPAVWEQTLQARIACFAHEINTPLGSSILAASHLEQKIEELARLFQSGAIKKNELEKHLHYYGESADIILTNLKIASDMVRSFRNESSDPFSDQLKSFKVKKQIETVLMTLKSRLTEQQASLLIDCDDQLEITGYPRLFSQIMINLINNSLIHAFEPEQPGTLSLQVNREADQFTLIYSDDGRGMDQSTLQNIFQPYFSTNHEFGSTGLGLSIIKSIVTEKFGGAITCTSEPGQGTTFTIQFPIH